MACGWVEDGRGHGGVHAKQKERTHRAWTYSGSRESMSEEDIDLPLFQKFAS